MQTEGTPTFPGRVTRHSVSELLGPPFHSPPCLPPLSSTVLPGQWQGEAGPGEESLGEVGPGAPRVQQLLLHRLLNGLHDSLLVEKVDLWRKSRCIFEDCEDAPSRGLHICVCVCVCVCVRVCSPHVW